MVFFELVLPDSEVRAYGRKMKNVKVSGTLGGDRCPVGVGLVGLVPWNVHFLHVVVRALWRFGGECICRFQLVGLEVYIYRFGGECVSKWSVVVNMLGGMVVRVQW